MAKRPPSRIEAALPGALPGALPSVLEAGRPLALVGMMGAGKTAVGRLLAARLGRPFVDSDDAIAAAARVASVRELFAREGEAGFRVRERRFIAELSSRSGHVLALGGGMFVGPENVRAIREAARTVWLRARPETLLARLSAAERAARPLLAGAEAGADAEGQLAALLAARVPWYAQAHLTIDTDGLAPAAVAALVLAALDASDFASPPCA